jgi:hypothetical protein
MMGMPDLWWSPSEGLIEREDGLCWLLTKGPLLEDGDAPLPADAVRLCQDMGSDYIRVGEMVSTEDGADSYRLALGPQRMYLEPIDFGEPHLIALARDGWTIKHPVTCRPNLFACRFNRAAKFSEPLGDRLGRFHCTIDDEGFLVLGEEVS